MQKTIFYQGDQINIVGSDADPYFMSISSEDHTNDFYATALAMMPKDGVMFDVGANVGLTAVMAASHAAMVYAFEPSPITFKHLTETVLANGLSERIRLINRGLSDHDGDLTFFQDPTSGSASHIITSSTLARASDIRVPVQTLDSFAQQQGITRLDLIKIDVEGFEIDVLRGAKETIERLRPSALIEFNAFTMVGFRNINPRDMLALIRETFPFVYRWKDGAASPIENDADALAFIHDNLVSIGCVDDLLGSFRPLQSLTGG